MRGSLYGDIKKKGTRKNPKLGNLCGGNLFLATGKAGKANGQKLPNLGQEQTDNKMHKSLLKMQNYSELFNYPWLPLHTPYLAHGNK